MRIDALTKKQILKSLSMYIPALGIAAVVYWLMLAMALIVLNQKTYNFPIDRIYISTFSMIVVIIFLSIYVNFFANLISSFYIEVKDDVLYIKASYPGGSKEMQFPIQDIDHMIFGQQLTRVESILDKINKAGVPKTSKVKYLKDIRAGKLVVLSEKAGDKTFNFINHAFDSNHLANFAIYLKNIGINVEISP